MLSKLSFSPKSVSRISEIRGGGHCSREAPSQKENYPSIHYPGKNLMWQLQEFLQSSSTSASLFVERGSIQQNIPTISEPLQFQKEK